MPYNPDEIRSIEDELEYEWPTLSPGGDHHGFWKHEWEKHGTCGTDFPSTSTQYGYFLQSLFLHAEGDWYSVLARAGIYPSDTRTYSFSQVDAAFKDILGVNVELVCYTYRSSNYFYEIRPCYNKFTMVLEDCSQRSSSCENGGGLVYSETA
eukprot:Lithocolla_globosa_v1_NODE_8721_length_789_cov_9.467302.p1 type:complete len:152 gc:universal NODE_8721_length_789_cov_9.467302:480-25(-)